MDTSKIGVRYARAFFDLVTEKKVTDAVRDDIILLEKVWRESDDLRAALLNPVISPSGKRKIMHSVFETQVQGITLQFLDLIIRNRREHYLPDILRRFLYLYRTSRGIKTAELVTAALVAPETTKRIAELIRKAFQTDVELAAEVRPAIIGGFILTVEDRQIDSSVATYLRNIKRQLVQ